MTNKFISLILSAVLIAGIIPSMSAFASGTTKAISGNVMNNDSFTSSDVSFYKESISDGGAVNSRSVKITRLEDAQIRLSRSITNNTNATKTVMFFAVLRENGKLKDMQFKIVDVQPSKTEMFNAGFLADDFENQSIETYIWDSFSGRNALAPLWSITSTGITTTKTE